MRGSMKNTLRKILEFLSVVIGLIIAVLVAKELPVESMLRGKEEPVTLAMTEDGLPEDFIGMPAADDIPRIEDAQTWEDTWQTSYVTVEPEAIIPTGIGTRHPWVSMYSSGSRRSGSRYRADVSDMAFDILGEYGEYFLIQLPDKSYILAQMSIDDARALKAGKKITLPVGRKGPVHQQALSKLEEFGKDYDVNTEGVFYCINDTWNESHEMIVLLIRFGCGALITLVIGVILITIVDKILKEKTED